MKTLRKTTPSRNFQVRAVVYKNYDFGHVFRMKHSSKRLGENNKKKRINRVAEALGARSRQMSMLRSQ